VYSIQSDVINFVSEMQREGGFILVSSINKYGRHEKIYYTPDGAVIHFMGTCKYTLWNSTIPNDRCEFRVETKNERRSGNNNVLNTYY
jgi:hypothetical protein